MDKFPEAFNRFERIVDIHNVERYQQLEMMFASWSGPKWKGTTAQREALRIEARKRSIGVGISRRRFSAYYESYTTWRARRPRTSTYERRISSYMSSHPHATLKEARGHR